MAQTAPLMPSSESPNGAEMRGALTTRNTTTHDAEQIAEHHRVRCAFAGRAGSRVAVHAALAGAAARRALAWTEPCGRDPAGWEAMVQRPPAGSIPDAPGSYQFKDAHGRVIYVGKAKSLRSRLSNYFQNPREPAAAHRADGGRRPSPSSGSRSATTSKR